MFGTLTYPLLPLAVHIPDGFLTAPWLLGGLLLAGLLVLISAYRIRDEEIPRIAVLSAAFFVATLMHLPLGPTSVHLLLCGLVGVVLGRRAPLAILLGLGLQAALFGHGGFTTIGVNACVQSLPALLAAWWFSLLCRLPPARRGSYTALWIIGCLIGMSSVLMALALESIVLLLGGMADWTAVVVVLFVAHLPVVLVEGVVLGSTVAFLARVKPEMLGLIVLTKHKRNLCAETDGDNGENKTKFTPLPLSDIRAACPEIRPPVLLFVLLSLLFAATPARAHRLNAGYSILKDQNIRIEAWFDLRGVPRGATVEVYRPQKRLLVKGKLDDKGCFTFHFDEAEALDVIVSAADGHRKTFIIPQSDLQQAGKATSHDLPEEPSENVPPFRVIDETAAFRERIKEALLGVSFLLSLAAFILTLRLASRLRSLERNRITHQASETHIRSAE